MIDLMKEEVNQFRDHSTVVFALYGSAGDGGNGRFILPSPIDGADMYVIASNGGGWDHVSVSRKKRCPNWAELDFVKDLFFAPGETVMQLHVPRAEHINDCPTCLHLWRPHNEAIPRPPPWMVGFSERGGEDDEGR